MALLSTNTTSSNSDFTGYFEAGITKVEDKSAQFDWADCWLDVTFSIKGSQYPQVHQIKGSYERNPDGTLEINKVIRHFNYLKDAIGFTGGINTEGKWETIDGEEIPDIAKALNEHIMHINGTSNPLIEPPHNYYIYIYKEAPKKPGDTIYKRVLGKVVLNDSKGKQDLKSYVTYMDQKGYLKKATDDDISNVKTTKKPDEDMPF